MAKVPPAYLFAAFIPAVMVAGLYFFDHSVASQMAQQKNFNLRKPSAYHYDILVLGVLVYNLNSFAFSTCMQVPLSPRWIHQVLNVSFIELSRLCSVDWLDSLHPMEYSHNLLCTRKVWLCSVNRLVRQVCAMSYDKLIFLTVSVSLFWNTNSVDKKEDGKRCQGMHEAKCQQLRNLWQDAGCVYRNQQNSTGNFTTYVKRASISLVPGANFCNLIFFGSQFLSWL